MAAGAAQYNLDRTNVSSVCSRKMSPFPNVVLKALENTGSVVYNRKTGGEKWGKVGNTYRCSKVPNFTATGMERRSMFLGEYEHSIDTKGRVAVPAKFRTQLEGGLVVTRGFERCLQVYPMEQWQALSERVSGLSLGSTEARQLRRLLFASAFDTELDKQGRILLPAGLREYAGIGDTAVVAGMNTYFEIWSQEAWDAAMEALDESANVIAAQMAEIGI